MPERNIPEIGIESYQNSKNTNKDNAILKTAFFKLHPATPPDIFSRQAHPA